MKAIVPCPFCSRLNRVELARLTDLPKCGECTRPLRLDRPLRVTDADLDKVVAGTEVPVLVDFYADWCGPCKVMAPVLDDVAHEAQGRLLVLKLDTDRNPGMAQRYSIRGIPTLVAFHGGRETGRSVGAVGKAQILKLVEQP